MKPLIICLPFWKGDMPQLDEMVDLILALQHEHAGAEVAFMLIPRQDAPEDPELERRLKRKFNVFSYRSPSPLRGWPDGCNGMFGAACNFFHTQDAYRGKVDAFYWMEADCCPMRPWWWRDLKLAWYARPPGVHVVGYMAEVEQGKPETMHITGCAIYDAQIGSLFPRITSCGGMAWDYACRRWICQHGQHTDLILNRFRCVKAKRSELLGPASVIHGFKDSSLRDLVRKEIAKKS